MKELTIEQKAQRYDEAIEIAKRINNEQQAQPFNIMTRVFPELKESEDEKIRKEILDYIIKGSESLYDVQQYGKERFEKWIAWLEKQGEQKPAENAEPKFHEGNWVFIEEIKGYKNGPFQIKSVDSFGYSFDEYHTIPFMYEDLLSKWTTQDAKDGDVLYLQKDGKEHIIIYKGVIKERFRTFVSAYCAYNGIVDAFCFADVSRYVDIAYGGIMPATKEQRDLLFQKMYEAGYEWDAENKQLKKIRVQPQPKQEWSEEDEKMLGYALDMIEWYSGKNEDKSRLVSNWLKSLRPQNTWKPSDEQMNALNYVVNLMASSERPTENDLYYNILKSLRQQLKKHYL